MTRKSIRFQLNVRITTAVTFMWLASIILSIYIMNDEMNEVFDLSLKNAAQQILPYAEKNTEPTHPPVLGLHHDDDVYLIYQIRNEQGVVLDKSFDASETPLSAKLFEGYEDHNGMRVFSQKMEGSGNYVQVAEPLEHRAEAIGESVWALVIPLFLLIPLTSFLVIWAVRKALLPIRLLNQDIRKRGKENLDEFDSSKQPEELLPMITSLNGLMKRIGFAIGAEREFASNSAHELRTPIAATLAQVQRLIALNENPEIHRRALEIEGGLNRLKRLSEKLLQLSRADASALRKGEVTNVHMVFQHIVEELSHGEPDSLPLKFDAENLSSLNWPLDIDGVAIILRNLVENAMRYRLEDSKIEIFCDQDNGLHVVNDCKTLEKAKVERLTQRFERGHNHEGGAGLGLAIVDTFVQHGTGKLSIFSPAIDKESGFEIVVKF